MRSSLLVMCVKKTDRSNTHEAISHVGGMGWEKTQEAVLAEILAGTMKYFVRVRGRARRLVVATSAQGDRYLKVESDHPSENSLTLLPERMQLWA